MTGDRINNSVLLVCGDNIGKNIIFEGTGSIAPQNYGFKVTQARSKVVVGSAPINKYIIS
tara:strand:+ start:331 stop:510 length:180 start_codon:yes stop_codon:yes gene_type:complete